MKPEIQISRFFQGNSKCPGKFYQIPLEFEEKDLLEMGKKTSLVLVNRREDQ